MNSRSWSSFHGFANAAQQESAEVPPPPSRNPKEDFSDSAAPRNYIQTDIQWAACSSFKDEVRLESEDNRSSVAYSERVFPATKDQNFAMSSKQTKHYRLSHKLSSNQERAKPSTHSSQSSNKENKNCNLQRAPVCRYENRHRHCCCGSVDSQDHKPVKTKTFKPQAPPKNPNLKRNSGVCLRSESKSSYISNQHRSKQDSVSVRSEVVLESVDINSRPELRSFDHQRETCYSNQVRLTNPASQLTSPTRELAEVRVQTVDSESLGSKDLSRKRSDQSSPSTQPRIPALVVLSQTSKNRHAAKTSKFELLQPHDQLALLSHPDDDGSVLVLRQHKHVRSETAQPPNFDSMLDPNTIQLETDHGDEQIRQRFDSLRMADCEAANSQVNFAPRNLDKKQDPNTPFTSGGSISDVCLWTNESKILKADIANQSIALISLNSREVERMTERLEQAVGSGLCSSQSLALVAEMKSSAEYRVRNICHMLDLLFLKREPGIAHSHILDVQPAKANPSKETRPSHL